MMNLSQVVEKVAKQISPTKEEAAAEQAFARGLVSKLEKGFGNSRQLIKIIHCGSSARDTGLKNDGDIDLFIAFNKRLERNEIVKSTIEVTKKSIPAKWEMHYAEHPYLHAEIGKYSVEVIPCFQHNPHEDIKSAVDRSPLHMTYLQDKLSAGQRKEVRVLKKLLKVAKIYGAENEIEGFSGLVCEYLILHYGSLENLLKSAAAEWRFPVIIDTEKFHENINELKKKYENNAIILIDVIDRNRNAAAAISKTNAAKFVLLARNVLKKPSMKFFKEKKDKNISTTEFKKTMSKRGTKIIAIEFSNPQVVHDTLVPQIRSSAHFIAKHLSMNALQMNYSHFFVSDNKCFIAFEFEKWESKIKQIQGPPIDSAKACEQFLKAKKIDKKLLRLFVKDLKLVAEVKPKFKDADGLIQDVKRNPDKYGVANNLKKFIQKAEILNEAAIAKNDFLRNELVKIMTIKEFL